MTNNHIARTRDGIVWHQVARNRAEDIIGERDVILVSDMEEMVRNFDEFCSRSGADRYTSIGTAMNEVNAQARALVSDVYFAEREDQVIEYEPLVVSALSLFKALEAFYVQNCSLRTGT